MKSNILSLAIEGLRRLLFLVPSHPEVAQIEITNRCNFNCAMCQRFPLKVPIKDMDFNIYKKIINKLDGVDEVILTGWGEPLLHPKIIEMVKFAKQKNKSVNFTSNGSLLSKELARKILDCRLDSISFSIDDVKAPRQGSLVHPVTTQIKNIEYFMKLRETSVNKPVVVLQSTLHKGKERKIGEVVKWGSAVGASMVNVNRLDLRFQKLKRLNLRQERDFIRQLNKLGKKYRLRTEFRPHIAFTGPARIFYQLTAPFMARGGQHCLRVYNYIYINMKGEVTPCCALPLWSVGNILKQNLGEIWTGEKFQKFRQHDFQRQVCGKCDVLEVKQWA